MDRCLTGNQEFWCCFYQFLINHPTSCHWIVKTLRQIYSVFVGTFTGCKMLCARDVHLIFWNACHLFSQVPTVTFSFSSWYLLGIIRNFPQTKKCLWCWCSVTSFEQGVPEVSTPCCASGDRLLQELPAPGRYPTYRVHLILFFNKSCTQ